MPHLVLEYISLKLIPGGCCHARYTIPVKRLVARSPPQNYQISTIRQTLRLHPLDFNLYTFTTSGSDRRQICPKRNAEPALPGDRGNINLVLLKSEERFLFPRDFKPINAFTIGNPFRGQITWNSYGGGALLAKIVSEWRGSLTRYRRNVIHYCYTFFSLLYT